jgi:hypothetical protein
MFHPGIILIISLHKQNPPEYVIRFTQIMYFFTQNFKRADMLQCVMFSII